jgi:hypothetical protein
MIISLLPKAMLERTIEPPLSGSESEGSNQTARIRWFLFLAYPSALKMEAVWSSEALDFYWLTCCYILVDSSNNTMVLYYEVKRTEH